MQSEKKQYKVFVVGFLLVLLVIFWFFAKSFISSWRDREKKKDEQKANEEILKAPSITADELFAKIQKGSKVFLIDISVSDDFKRGHIATAVNVPAENLTESFLKGIGAEKTADIFVMNQEDDLVRLAATVNKIISAGFANTKYLRGGLSDWKEKGYPLVSLGSSEADAVKVKKITLEEIKKEAGIIPDLLQFLDVRDSDSFSREHIVGAINIPLLEIEKRKNEIPATKKVIVYGSNENESFQAAVILFDLNLFNIYQMQGGIEDWKAAGGNVESGK